MGGALSWGGLMGLQGAHSRAHDTSGTGQGGNPTVGLPPNTAPHLTACRTSMQEDPLTGSLGVTPGDLCF